MPPCKAKKSDGELCRGNASDGEKYCATHKRRASAAVTHGRRTTPELLGVPKGEQLTFEEFHNLRKPFELTAELAYLRTLIGEQRRAMELQRDTSRETFLEDLRDRSFHRMLEANMKEPVIDKLLEALFPIWENIIEAYYGPVEPLQPEQFQMLADMIEKISRVAEKAKKIQEGITLNVDFKNVGQILIRFCREVIFTECDRPTRERIVARVRNMNLTGQSVRMLSQPQVLETVYE